MVDMAACTRVSQLHFFPHFYYGYYCYYCTLRPLYNSLLRSSTANNGTS